MLHRHLFLVTLGFVLSAPFAVAETTDCSAPVIIVPDGRLTSSTFPQAATYWYGIYAQAGHSYSVEFISPTDNSPNVARPFFSPLSIFGPTDYLQSCRGTSSVVVTQNSGYAPVILKGGNGAGRRVSFTSQFSGLHLIAATNGAGTGGYTFRATDTTLFSPRWGTNGSHDTQWGFLNVSDMPVTGTLTLYDVNGQVVAVVTVSTPPGGRVIRNTSSSDLNLSRNLAGSATFSHNAPPSSILADAYITSSEADPLPVKFEPLPSR